MSAIKTFDIYDNEMKEKTCFHRPSINSVRRKLPDKSILYGIFEGYGDTLRAFKVLGMLYGDYYTFALVNIAGVGVKYINAQNDFYESKEDFLDNDKTSIFSDEEIDFTKTIRRSVNMTTEGYPCHNYLRFYRYMWVNNKVEDVRCDLHISYDVASDSLDCSWDYYCVKYKDPSLNKDYEGVVSFLTREECIANAAPKVEVCDFEDETSKKADKIVLEVYRKIECESTDADNIVKNIKTAFGNKDYRIYINDKCAIEHTSNN